MNQELLQDIGFTPPQAQTYLALIKNGSQTAPELQLVTGESRTNIYMVLDKLIELGVVEKKAAPRKTSFRALNPLALERLAEQKKRLAMEASTKVSQAMPGLLNFFFTYSEQPGVRFFQGVEELAAVYEDILRTGKPVSLLRTGLPTENLTLPFFSSYVQKRVKKGITLDALTTRHAEANTDPDQDTEWLMTRTWLEPGAYDAPVEVNIYGDKVAYISFGQETIGMIIESPQIALAMRQMFNLMKQGAVQSSGG